MAVIKNAQSATSAKRAIVLDLGDLRRQAETLQREGMATAKQIVEEAVRERERLLHGAREEGFAAGKKEGIEKGLEEGRKEGHAEALKASSRNLNALTEGWARGLGDLEESRERIMHEARADLLRLAVAIAERVTKRVVECHPEATRDQLEAALALTMNPTRLVVEVCARDMPATTEALPALVERLKAGAHARIQENETLSPGSVVVRTENGTVDATIETQLQRLAEMLVPAREAAEGPTTSNPDNPPPASAPPEASP